MNVQKRLEWLIPCTLVFLSVPVAVRAQSAATAPAAATSATPAPIKPPVQIMSGGPFEWTGFYFGATVNFGSANADTTFAPLPDATQFVNMAPTTLTPEMPHSSFGFFGGMNRAMGDLIVGVEGEYVLGSPDGSTTVSPITQNNGTAFNGTLSAGQFTDWMVTVRARAGKAYGPMLVYGTGGVAFAGVEYVAEADFRPQGTTRYPAEVTKTKVGWTAGGGVEYQITKRLRARGELRLINLGSESATANPTPALPPFQVAYTWQTRSFNFSAGAVIRF